MPSTANSKSRYRHPALLWVVVTASCGGLVSAMPAIGDTLQSEGVAAGLDWQPLPLVPEALRDRRCRQCGGAFVDPMAGEPEVDPLTAEIEISANDTDVTQGELIFTGDVTVRQGSRLLRADRVSFDRNQRYGDAQGSVTLREPGVVLIGDSAAYDSIADRATISNARFALHAEGLSGSAGSLTRETDGHLTVTDGAITFCAPDDPTWVLSSDEIEIDPDRGTGEAWHARLKVGDVPVFYVPWIQFPTDDRRKTGLLFPDIGSDTRGGLDVTTPLYLNLAPNYDATYAPRFIAERGINHQLNARWLTGKAGLWEFDGGYLGGDDKYSGNGRDSDDTRWLAAVRQQGSFGDSWRTRLDYARVSDTEYIRDFDNNSLSAQRQTALMQLGQIDYLGEDWLINLQAQQFQSLADDIRNDYKKLPQITAQWRGDVDWHGIEPLALVEYSNFDANGDRVTGQRTYAEAGVRYPMSWVHGFLRPTLKYRQVNYDLDNTPELDDTRPRAGSAVFSLDGGLVFERQLEIAGEGMTQTLEPRVFYLYSDYSRQGDQPDFDSAELTFSYNQLYRDTRFSGNDRLDDANQIALGVTTRFFADSDGRERLNASIGQIYYFRDREVRLNAADPNLTESSSPIAAELSWLPSERWSVRGSFLYDADDSSFDAASARVEYHPGNGRVFNMGYTLREPPPSLLDRPVTEQANISAYYPIDDNWSVFGAIEYSLEASRAVEDMVGFEYDDCCWQVRVLYMRYVDTAGGFNTDFTDFTDPNLERENAIQFQFVLKGMGGFGGRVENLLNDMIRGFGNRYRRGY